MRKQIILISCLLLFISSFAVVVSKEMPLIFHKDLYQHDESSNSVVAANLTRKMFPPMVRVNPLYPIQGIWMEGPYWQHIPPLFTYVPLPFFAIDGHVSIEVKRLSYAFVLLLTGILFILSIYFYERKKVIALGAATLTAVSFILIPFSRGLVTGISFGTSDIVLAFSVVCSFAALSWYFFEEREARKQHGLWKLVVIAMIVALPILTKNILGAIPAVTYFIALIYDQGRINRKVVFSFSGLIALLLLYFGSLYLSSPITFKNEILLPLMHTGQNFEGWGRPWYYFVTAYLPQQYFHKFWIPFVLLFLFGLVTLFRTKIEPRTKRLLILSAGWFIWNLFAISLVSAKVPNFIYQSVLFGIFFAIYSTLLTLEKFKPKSFLLTPKLLNGIAVLCLFLAAMLFIYTSAHAANKFKNLRNTPYLYQSEHEKYYQLGELMQKEAGPKDLFIFNASTDDCWFRYYTLFLTGAESRTFDEVHGIADVGDIKNRYEKVYFVLPKINNALKLSTPYQKKDYGDYSVLVFQTKDIPSNFLDSLKTDVLDSLHLDINLANQSCEWLMQSEDLFHRSR